MKKNIDPDLVKSVIKSIKEEDDAYLNTSINFKKIISQFNMTNINNEIKMNFKKKILKIFNNNELFLLKNELFVLLLDCIIQLKKFKIIINTSFLELDFELFLKKVIKNFYYITYEYKKNNQKRFFYNINLSEYILFIFLLIIEHYELLELNKEIVFIQKLNYIEIELKTNKIIKKKN